MARESRQHTPGGEDKVQTDHDDDPITVEEVRKIAERKLPQNVYDYYASGSDDQLAVCRNARAFDR